jgi:hemerythrin superfamily protein
MDALSLLKKDHQAVKSLFKSIDSAKEGSSRQKSLFEELRRELEVHDAIEAKIFYPELKAHPKAKAIVAEAHEEHHVMKLLLAEMEKLTVKDEAWQAKFQVLMENVLHHAEEEETEMFPKARQAFEKAELDELGRKMAILKDRETARRLRR